MTVSNTANKEEEERRAVDNESLPKMINPELNTSRSSVVSKEDDTITNNSNKSLIEHDTPMNTNDIVENEAEEEDDLLSVYTVDNSVTGDQNNDGPKKRKKKKKSLIKRLSSRMSLTKKKKRRKEDTTSDDVIFVVKHDKVSLQQQQQEKEKEQHLSVLGDNVGTAAAADNGVSNDMATSPPLPIIGKEVMHDHDIKKPSQIETSHNQHMPPSLCDEHLQTEHSMQETLKIDTLLNKEQTTETILEEEEETNDNHETNKEGKEELTLPRILSNESSFDEDECDTNSSVVTDVSWDAQFSSTSSSSNSSSPRASLRQLARQAQQAAMTPPTPPFNTNHKTIRSSLSTTSSLISSTDNNPTKKLKPRGRKSVKFADEEGNPLISSTRSISPDPPSLSSHVSNSSLSSSLDGKLTRIIVLLMCPTTKQFELVSIYYDDTQRTELSYILQQIRSRATFPLLLKQRYVGLCKPDIGTEMINLLSVQDYEIEPNDVVIAIPKGLNGSVCAKLAKPILDDKRLIRLLIQRGKKRKKRRSSSASSTSSSSSASIPEQICVEEKTTDHLPSTPTNELNASSNNSRSSSTTVSTEKSSSTVALNKGKHYRYVVFIFMTVVTIIIIILFINTATTTASSSSETTTAALISPQNTDVSSQQQQQREWHIIQSNIDVWIVSLSRQLYLWMDGIITRHVRDLFQSVWNRGVYDFPPVASSALILNGEAEVVEEEGYDGLQMEDKEMDEMKYLLEQ